MVMLVVFDVYFREPEEGSDDRDKDARERFHENHKRGLQILVDRAIPYDEMRLTLDDLDTWTKLAQTLDVRTMVFDISTFPRSYILTMLRFIPRKPQFLAYTKVGRHRYPEDAYAIGLKNVITLPGFEGAVGWRPTLLVISLGYEGARAYSLFKRYDPIRTLAILGDPGEKDSARNKILETAKKNNSTLLSTDSVYYASLPSYDPQAFCAQCEALIERLRQSVEREQGIAPDIVLAPVGTKMQAIGLYEVWNRHQEYQMAYPIPMKRRRGTEEAGETLFYSGPEQ